MNLKEGFQYQNFLTSLMTEADEYLYDDEHNNLTNYLFLTNAQTLAGKGLVFPQLGTDEINLYMYYSGTTIDQGVGLIQIYPRWWKI